MDSLEVWALGLIFLALVWIGGVLSVLVVEISKSTHKQEESGADQGNEDSQNPL